MSTPVIASAQGIADVVAWYAPALGLSDWTIECRWNYPMVTDSQAEVQRDPCHRSAIVTVTDGSMHIHQRLWAAFHDPEVSAIHELVHIAMVDYELVVERALEMIPDGDAKAIVVAEESKHHERFVQAMATALKTVAYADRDGPQPTSGRAFSMEVK